MMTTPAPPPPVPVHVVSADVPLGTPPASRQRVITDSTRTIVVTATNPNPIALPTDESRDYAILIALDNQVVLCNSFGDAQDPSNLVVGLPNPQGSVLYVGIAVPTRGTNKMWLAAAVYPSRVTVIAGHKETPLWSPSRRTTVPAPLAGTSTS